MHGMKFDGRDFRAALRSGRTLEKIVPGRSLFSQGDVADEVYYIRNGMLKLTVVSRQGKQAVVAIIGASDFCGHECLAGEALRISTATTLTDCEVTRVDKPSMIRALREEPGVSELFVAHLLSRAIRAQADLVDHLFNSSEKRLARALLVLANFGKNQERFIPKISQEALADMVGTTRSRISFFMNKFRRLGFISYNGRIEVHCALLSEVLDDGPLTAASYQTRENAERQEGQG